MVLSFVFAVSYRAAPVSAASPMLSPGCDGIVSFVLLHHRRRDRDPAHRRYGARVVLFSFGHRAAPPSVATSMMPSSGAEEVASSFSFIIDGETGRLSTCDTGFDGAFFFFFGYRAAQLSVATPMPPSGGDGVASFFFLHH